MSAHFGDRRSSSSALSVPGRLRWQSEIDACCSAVLAQHWPGVPNLGDVRTIDWSTKLSPSTHCLLVGSPCQPGQLQRTRSWARR